MVHLIKSIDKNMKLLMVELHHVLVLMMEIVQDIS